MSRLPYIVLAACYRKGNDGVIEYALFKRAVFRAGDEAYWQIISGGGEGEEKPDEAVRREAFEEAGIPQDSRFFKLDMVSHVPVTVFRDHHLWPANLYVVPGYHYAVNAEKIAIRLSEEHTEYRWASFEKAKKLLKWQSDVTALWELEQRLQRNDLK